MKKAKSNLGLIAAMLLTISLCLIPAVIVSAASPLINSPNYKEINTPFEVAQKVSNGESFLLLYYTDLGGSNGTIFGSSNDVSIVKDLIESSNVTLYGINMETDAIPPENDQIALMNNALHSMNVRGFLSTGAPYFSGAILVEINGGAIGRSYVGPSQSIAEMKAELESLFESAAKTTALGDEKAAREKVGKIITEGFIDYDDEPYQIYCEVGDYLFATGIFTEYGDGVANGIFSRDGKLLVADIESASKFLDKYIVKFINGKTGVYSSDFKLLNNYRGYEDIVLYSGDSLLEVKKNGAWTILDKNLKEVTATTQNSYKNGNIKTYAFDAENGILSNTTVFEQWYANTGNSAHFFNHLNEYNIVYKAGDIVKVLIFDKNFNIEKTMDIAPEMPLFGTAISDSKGNIYIFYGNDVGENGKAENNMALVKYSADGVKLGSAVYNAGEENVKELFSGATASMAISGDILAVHFGRTMFMSDDGLNHQASTAVFMDINTFEPVSKSKPYTSHSFDQQVIPISEGGFLFVDRGDGFQRAFNIEIGLTSSAMPFRYLTDSGGSVITSSIGDLSGGIFHFREGMTYQYTYSTLGGMVETPYSYILAASSEKTLSQTPAPAPGNAPTESDNVFIQAIKKNFYFHKKSDAFLGNGETRQVSGTSGHKLGLNRTGQSYFLPDNTTDYGVIWLTNYSGNENAFNPKVVYLQNGDTAVMWEYWKDRAFVSVKYVIVDSFGNIKKAETELPNARLGENKHPLFSNNKIYWFVSTSGGKCTIYEFDPYSDFVNTAAEKIDGIGVVVNGKAVTFAGQQATIVSGSTLVPVRGVFEEMGFNVAYDNATKTATLKKDVSNVVITQGNSFFTVNGNTITPAVKPQIMNGSFMLPLRAISEATGATVDWNADTRTVSITTS